MPTSAQREFFRKLSQERDFSDTTAKDAQPAELQKMFDALDDRSASAWIEAALKRPKLDEAMSPDIEPPPF
jgi:hypothetical protein